MMRKVGNRSLLVTTSVPGHHRPTLSKQLKCQTVGAERRVGGGIPRVSGGEATFKSAAKARGLGCPREQRRLAPAQNTPDFAAVHALVVVPIKTAPSAGNIHQGSGTLPQPWRWPKNWPVMGCFPGSKEKN